MRSAEQLLAVADPAWPAIQQALVTAGGSAVVLPGGGAAGRASIEALQVTAQSALGAVAYHTGGILLDSGWLRVLGCGHPRCAWSIIAATHAVGWARDGAAPVGVVVGVDVLGGLYAINGGAISGVSPGGVGYLAPDTLEWLPLEMGHSAWLQATLDDDFREAFYAHVRWNGWREEVSALADNHGLSVYPPLWAMESRPIERTSRRAVPLVELVGLLIEQAGG